MSSGVLVFSIALEGYDRLFESCIETQRQYSRRCGYEYVLVDRAPRRLQPEEAAWLKLAFLESALKAGHEWVAFIDADCDVRAGMPCFAEYLESVADDKSIFLSTGYSGRINSGVIFARHTPAAIEFFQTVLARADQEVPHEDRALYENGHMIHYGKNSQQVYLLEHNVWNNNSKLDGQSYIQHYSGGDLRLWFMKHRAPAEFQSTAQGQTIKLIKKVPRKIGKLLTKLLHREPSMVAGIRGLMPFYKQAYPAFSSEQTNS